MRFGDGGKGVIRAIPSHRVCVESGHLDGVWQVRVRGEFGCVTLTSRRLALAYADELELCTPDLAPVAAMVRRHWERCELGASGKYLS